MRLHPQGGGRPGGPPRCKPSRLVHFPGLPAGSAGLCELRPTRLASPAARTPRTRQLPRQTADPIGDAATIRQKSPKPARFGVHLDHPPRRLANRGPQPPQTGTLPRPPRRPAIPALDQPSGAWPPSSFSTPTLRPSTSAWRPVVALPSSSLGAPFVSTHATQSGSHRCGSMIPALGGPPGRNNQHPQTSSALWTVPGGLVPAPAHAAGRAGGRDTPAPAAVAARNGRFR